MSEPALLRRLDSILDRPLTVRSNPTHAAIHPEHEAAVNLLGDDRAFRFDASRAEFTLRAA
jgi:hypothetical protein